MFNWPLFQLKLSFPQKSIIKNTFTVPDSYRDKKNQYAEINDRFWEIRKKYQR